MPGVSFGQFSFDRETLLLTRSGEPVDVSGPGTALLAALVGANGGVVSKDELLNRAWPDVVVGEANLTVQIAALRKALGTRPDGRDWIATVRRVGYRLLRDTESGAIDMPTIAVLPFADFSADASGGHFADGLVEDLITALSRFKTFAVVARQSSFAYRDRQVDVRVIAEELGVRYVLEGSVRRAGPTVRVATQLIDARTGLHLWAAKHDGPIEEMLDFQDRVTDRVIASAEPRIRMAEVERSRRRRPESFDAYELYLRALGLLQGFEPSGYGEAISLLERAMALDPGFAPAVALAAWAHAKRMGRPAPAGVDDARECLRLSERAVALDNDDAQVLAIAGRNFLDIGGQPARGYALTMRALSLNPNSPLVVNYAGHAYHMLGEYDEARACFLRALQLIPGSPDAIWAMLGIASCDISLGHFEDAEAWCRRALATYAGSEWAHAMLASALAHLGRLAEAGQAIRCLHAIRPGATVAQMFPGTPRENTGDRMFIEGLLAAGLPEC